MLLDLWNTKIYIQNENNEVQIFYFNLFKVPIKKTFVSEQ